MVSLDQIGIYNFSSYNLKGKLFEREEDFIVQEIEEDSSVLSIEKEETSPSIKEKKDFLQFTLVKRGLSTPEAVKILSRELHISPKRIAYNGNKDKRAITSQRISIFKFEVEKLNIKEERMFCRDIIYNDQQCKIGKLYGNHFTVTVKQFGGQSVDLGKISEEIFRGIPNFYGPQRFGSSSLNIEVSRRIIKKDLKNAFYNLVFTERNESEMNRKKRGELREVFFDYFLDGGIDEQAARETIMSLPRFMYYEREALVYLLQHKNDYAGAMRLMPKYTRLLILQSYQYYLFNKTLSKILLEKGLKDIKEIPLVGYDLDLKEGRVSDIIRETLKEEGIDDLQVFRINSMPEASLKTFNHPAFFIPKDFNMIIKDDNATITFDLEKGSYATILLIKLFGINNLYKSNE